MDPLLFGLTDPSTAVWASQAKPVFNGQKLAFSAPLGAQAMVVTTTNNEEKIVTEVEISFH